MPYPSVAQLSGKVTYSNGTLFDGYVLLVLAFPAGYESASIANQLIEQTIGSQIKVRIIQGVYDQSARIYYNSSLEPPNTQYVAYYYDNNDRQLGVSALFTVTSNPYTISQPSLTSPAATTIIPTPGGDSSQPVVPTVSYGNVIFPADQYNFTANGHSNLSLGNNTLTMSPVPGGVNGSDPDHWLYITDGTGTSEAVLITGGTAMAGAVSGTITFVTTHPHSGAWTISSATSGIQEAIIATGGVGRVLMSSSYYPLYAAVTVPGSFKISLRGVGQGITFIRTMDTSSRSWINFPAGSQGDIDLGDFSIINNTNSTQLGGSMIYVKAKPIGLISNIEIENSYDGLTLDNCSASLTVRDLHIGSYRRGLYLTTSGVNYPYAQIGGSYSNIRVVNTIDACIQIEGPTSTLTFSNCVAGSFPPTPTNYCLQIEISDSNPSGEIIFNNCIFDECGNAVRIIGHGPSTYTNNWYIFNNCEANGSEYALFIDGLVQNVYWNGGLIKAAGGTANQPVNLVGTSPTTGPKNIQIKDTSMYGDGAYAIAAVNAANLTLSGVSMGYEGGTCSVFMLIQGTVTGFIQNCDFTNATTGRILSAGGASYSGLRVVDFSNAFYAADLSSMDMASGSTVLCRDGLATNPLTGGGSGCIARRLGSVWIGI